MIVLFQNINFTSELQTRMNDVIINGTNKLPTVNLDSKAGLIELSGRSIPEDGKEFYDDILKWIRDYSQQPADETLIEFRFEYLNSSSHISIKNLIRELHALHRNGHSVTIRWYFEQEDSSMYDIANDYKDISSNLPFEIIAVDRF